MVASSEGERFLTFYVSVHSCKLLVKALQPYPWNPKSQKRCRDWWKRLLPIRVEKNEGQNPGV